MLAWTVEVCIQYIVMLECMVETSSVRFLDWHNCWIIITMASEDFKRCLH